MVEPRYRIGAVARLSGLTTHAIRVWERRYGILKPDRSPGGARLYSDADVERLRALKRAVDRGHSIGQIADLEPSELERLGGGKITQLPVFGGENTQGLVDEFVDAVSSFDAARAEQLLERASVVFSARAMVLDVLSPLLVRIGKDWASGTLCTASEHVASALIRDRASILLRQLARERGSETVVVTTPAGELHELGAFLAAATAAMQGYNVLYLGPNLPASEIAIATESSSASVIALSVIGLAASKAVTEVRAIASLVPPPVELVLGGPLASSIAAEAGPRIVAPGSLGDFELWLIARSKRRSARSGGARF
jgi:DNA-binding transcriptional MerR regulator